MMTEGPAKFHTSVISESIIILLRTGCPNRPREAECGKKNALLVHFTTLWLSHLSWTPKNLINCEQIPASVQRSSYLSVNNVTLFHVNSKMSQEIPLSPTCTVSLHHWQYYTLKSCCLEVFHFLYFYFPDSVAAVAVKLFNSALHQRITPQDEGLLYLQMVRILCLTTPKNGQRSIYRERKPLFRQRHSWFRSKWFHSTFYVMFLHVEAKSLSACLTFKHSNVLFAEELKLLSVCP